MSVRVGWENGDRTIIRFRFQRGWTWDDLYAAITQADGLIASVEYAVNVIIDIQDAGALPADFMTAARDIFASGEARPNEGVRVVVGAGRLAQMAYNGIRRVYIHKLEDRPFLFASSLDEAYALLDGHSPDTP